MAQPQPKLWILSTANDGFVTASLHSTEVEAYIALAAAIYPPGDSTDEALKREGLLMFISDELGVSAAAKEAFNDCAEEDFSETDWNISAVDAPEDRRFSALRGFLAESPLPVVDAQAISNIIDGPREAESEAEDSFDELYRAAAEEKWGARDGIDIDAGAPVSGSNDAGAYVQAWVWVSDAEAGIPARAAVAAS